MYSKGFTLVELIIVIVILGILAVTAAPRFIDISSDAKRASLESIAGSIKSTTSLVKAKAIASGLRPMQENPLGGGGNQQEDLVIDFGFGRAEVDWRNLCPEARAESGDAMNFFDFMQLSEDDKLSRRFDNQYAVIGYDVPASGTPTNQGCYVIYDSFACSVQVIDVDC